MKIEALAGAADVMTKPVRTAAMKNLVMVVFLSKVSAMDWTRVILMQRSHQNCIKKLLKSRRSVKVTLTSYVSGDNAPPTAPGATR